MRTVFFISQAQFDLYKPYERYSDNRLLDLGIKNLLCGGDALVVCPARHERDHDLPAAFHLATEKA